jgi:hypothetical protein
MSFARDPDSSVTKTIYEYLISGVGLARMHAASAGTVDARERYREFPIV